MGQKISSTLYRLGEKSSKLKWDFYQTEKNIQETSSYLVKSLYIKTFIARFFRIHGLLVNQCNLSYCSNVLKVYISFFIMLESVTFIEHQNFLSKVNTKGSYESLKRHKKLRTNTGKFLIPKPIFRKRFTGISNKKIESNKQKWKKKKIIFKNCFSTKLLQCLKLFCGTKTTCKIVFQNLSKGFSVRLKNIQSKIFRQIVLKLRMYSRFTFFKEVINIYAILIDKSGTSKLFAEFIALQLCLEKKHNMFITFLKRSLILFIKSRLSCLKGFRINFKGRLNGVSRAKTKNLFIGKIPLQTLSEDVDYSSVTAYTTNGTIGVKVWLC